MVQTSQNSHQTSSASHFWSPDGPYQWFCMPWPIYNISYILYISEKSFYKPLCCVWEMWIYFIYHSTFLLFAFLYCTKKYLAGFLLLCIALQKTSGLCLFLSKLLYYYQIRKSGPWHLNRDGLAWTEFHIKHNALQIDSCPIEQLQIEYVSPSIGEKVPWWNDWPSR